MALILLGLAIGFGLAAIYPYVIYPLLLRLLPRKPLKINHNARRVTATLVFCAYNEEDSLAAKLENLRAIRAAVPDMRFMAYVDKSTDASLEILSSEPDLIEVIAATERTGKAVGMRRLTEAAKTDVLIFTDANVIVEPESVKRLLEYFTDPEVGGVCGTLVYTNGAESVTARTGSVYWRLEEFIKQGESRSGSTMGADGSLFATRRTLYPEVPGHLLDDLIVSMSVIFAGKRLVSAADVVAYERTSAVSEDEFRRKRRIACRAYASHVHIWPNLVKMPRLEFAKYVSHRLMRWYSGFNALICAILLLLFVGMAWGGMATFAVLLAGALAYALGRMSNLPPLSHMTEVIKAIIAASLGLIDAWRGKRYQTWQPARTP
jgi:cellulose synthase/poly-beta-1,6-N-acetylglucosamine synthase-like glycosyltransferase